MKWQIAGWCRLRIWWRCDLRWASELLFPAPHNPNVNGESNSRRENQLQLPKVGAPIKVPFRLGSIITVNILQAAKFSSILKVFQDATRAYTHHARIRVHNLLLNLVRKGLIRFLQRHASADWSIFEKIPLSLAELQLKPGVTAPAQQVGQEVKDFELQAGDMSLNRWQPDIFFILFAKKTIAIAPEGSRHVSLWLSTRKHPGSWRKLQS